MVLAACFGFELWRFLFALVDDEGTAGMEGATGGRIDGAGDFAGENGMIWFSMGVGLRDGV